MQERLVGVGIRVEARREDDQREVRGARAIAQKVSELEMCPTAGYQISIGRLRTDIAGEGDRAGAPRAVSTVKPDVLPTGKTSVSIWYGAVVGVVVAKGCSLPA